MKLNQAFALRMKKILNVKKLTLFKWEQKTGLSHSTLNDILSCKSPIINLNHISLIIKALGMSMAEFFDSELFDFNNLDLEEENLDFINILNDILNHDCKNLDFNNLALIIKALGTSIAEFFDSELFDFDTLIFQE